MVRIEADDNLTVDGLMTANGGGGGYDGGGGSGGGIYVKCKRFLGATSGYIAANGGLPSDGQWAGGGGGGRIAIFYGVANGYQGAYPVAMTNGTGNGSGMTNPASYVQGSNGTVVINWLTYNRGAIFILR